MVAGDLKTIEAVEIGCLIRTNLDNNSEFASVVQGSAAGSHKGEQRGDQERGTHDGGPVMDVCDGCEGSRCEREETR